MFRRYLPIAIIGLALLVTVAAGVVLYRKSTQARPVTQAEPAPVEPGADPPHSSGPSGAPVTLEEFGDFQCGACVELHFELKRIKEDYADRLRFVFRQSPLQKIHNNAMEAARAAEAAALQGRFWEMHDWLYQHQGMWDGEPDPRPAFINAARSMGLDVKRFQGDLDGELVNGRINLDLERGKSLEIPGTPTVLLNGQLLGPTASSGQALRAAIDRALNGEN